MRRLVIAIVLLSGVAWGQGSAWYEPQASPSKLNVPWVRVPEIVPIPVPVPPPTPGAVPKLSVDEWYVLDCLEPCFILVSPPGIVTVSEDVGPIKLRGRFVGGTGKIEAKTFTGKKVFAVEAVSKGRVELIVVKEGAKSKDDIFRQLLDVNVGPLPPPTPPTPPTPPDPVIPDKLGFVALAASQAKTIPDSARVVISSLADNFESIAGKLAATDMTIDQANAELRGKNRLSLGDHRTAWLPWFQAWQALADKHNQSGTMTTKEHYVIAYRETAAGLRTVK